MGRGWPRDLLAVAVSTCVALAVADAAVWLFLTPPAADTQGLYEADPLRGHSHVPGFAGTVRTSADFSVTINANGYRDAPWTFEAPHRVLVVGDSFTFGEPLPADRTLFANLQRMFADEPLRFYNAGVSGYGLAQVLATVTKECPVVRPERVLYLFYLNDTSWDALRTDATTVVDGWLVPAREVGDPERRLSEAEIRARIADVLKHRRLSVGDVTRLAHIGDALKRRGLWPAAGGRTKGAMLTSDASIYPPAQTPRAAEELRAIAAAAQQCGAAFTMVILASDWEARLGVREPATERLLAAVAGDHLDIFDLRDVAELGKALRLPNDNHYNPEAAAWAAGAIAAHLRGLPAPVPAH